MTAHKEIIKTINNLKAKDIELSKDGIAKILNATKSITPHKDTVDALLFFLNTSHYRQNANETLTKRELQVLHDIGNGKTSLNIAKKLNLSISTVETHRKNIRKKLNLVGKGKLIQYAILNNLKQRAL